MNPKLDTLLAVLNVFLTDGVLPDLGHAQPGRSGRKAVLSDSELLGLAVAQHLLQGHSSESRWVRYARTRLAGFLPGFPQQSGCTLRVRAAGTLISAVSTALARDADSWHQVLLDSTPVPCGTSRETVNRPDLAGDAGYGYLASHSCSFRGGRLYLTGTPEGMPVIRGLAKPKFGERELTGARPRPDHHLLRDRQVILADKGFAGREFERFITEDLGAHLIRPDRKDEKPRFGKFGGIRQWIESILDTLKGQLGLEHHGARTLEWHYARVASMLLALAAGIWRHWKARDPRKRSLTAYDH